MTITPVFGLRGSGDWTYPDERPKFWRQELLRNYPQGDLPLTALMSKTGKEIVGDLEFHWWEKDLVSNAGAVPAGLAPASTSYAGIFSGGPDTTQVTTGVSTAVGTTLWVMIDATATDPVTNYVVVGSDIRLCKSTDYRVNVIATVLAIERGAGAHSYLKIRTLTADAASADYNLGQVDRIMVLPTTFSEFGGVPAPLSYKPGSFYNYTSIKKASAAMSRTAMSVKNIRPDSNDWKEIKRETLEALGIQMEWELIFGARSESTDPVTGFLIRRSMGIRQYLSTYGLAANIASYKYDTDYSGKTWLQGGFDWLMHKFKDLSLYTNLNTGWNVVGSGVQLGLAMLAHKYSTIILTPKTVEYGINVTQLTTPFGSCNILSHPLFNREPSMQNSWIGIPRGGMIYHTIEDPDYGNSDIRYLPDPNYGKGGLHHVDGKFDLWLVECGYEFNYSKGWFWLNDVGQDNVV